jgi:magnesium chelatase family protein
MAAAILIATGQLDASLLGDSALVGELALDGTVRPVPGLLSHALACERRGRGLIGPRDGAASVGAIPGARYGSVEILGDLVRGSIADAAGTRSPSMDSAACPDMADVRGHQLPRRALEIAAAGSHDLLMTGPPGSGKTLLGRCLCGILPPLSRRGSLQAALVHSVAGSDTASILAGVRPFRAVHHSATAVGLIGGGRPLTPGEVSLAHHGVLFLDELSEFAPRTLQMLRQPLEDKRITVVRADERATFPCDFMLVAATNPCACGFLGDPDRACECTQAEVRRHSNRIGGPLMDRIDLAIRVDRVDPKEMIEATPAAEASSRVRERVIEARLRRHARAEPDVWDSRTAVAACSPAPGALERLSEMARVRRLSARGILRVLRIARTIADLDRRDVVTVEDVHESLLLRGSEATI